MNTMNTMNTTIINNLHKRKTLRDPVRIQQEKEERNRKKLEAEMAKREAANERFLQQLNAAHRESQARQDAVQMLQAAASGLRSPDITSATNVLGPGAVRRVLRQDSFLDQVLNNPLNKAMGEAEV